VKKENVERLIFYLVRLEGGGQNLPQAKREGGGFGTVMKFQGGVWSLGRQGQVGADTEEQ